MLPTVSGIIINRGFNLSAFESFLRVLVDILSITFEVFVGIPPEDFWDFCVVEGRAKSDDFCEDFSDFCDDFRDDFSDFCDDFCDDFSDFSDFSDDFFAGIGFRSDL